MESGLHIIPVQIAKGDTYDSSFGSLVLAKASSFKITIKEIDDELKNITSAEKKEAEEINKNYREAKKQAGENIDQERDKVIAEQKSAQDFIDKDYATKGAGGWTAKERDSYAANTNVFNENAAKRQKAWENKLAGYNKKISDLEKENQDKLSTHNTKFEDLKKGIQTKYSELNWAWQLSGNHVSPATLKHNNSFSKGVADIIKYGYREISFQEIVEGGGLLWLEAFMPLEGPTGKIPNGLYVQGLGKAAVLRSEWTDFDYNPVKGPAAYGSAVILHIYTGGMYGQEVEISLMDKNVFIKDDTLPFLNEKVFNREIDVFKIKPFEDKQTGVDGVLTVVGTDGNEKKEQYIQKIEIKVIIDKVWEHFTYTSLSIYPTVKSLKTDTYLKWDDRKKLDVEKSGTPLTAPDVPLANNPAMEGKVETNVAAFHPCQYTELTFVDDKKKELILYKEKPGIQTNPHVELNLISSGEVKKYAIKADADSDTTYCRFQDKRKHKLILDADEKTLPSNIKILSDVTKEIDFESAFEYSVYDNIGYITKYIWPINADSGAAIKKWPLKAITCRHQHDIDITIYPDIKWELKFFLNLTNDLSVKWQNKSAEEHKKLQQKAGKIGAERRWQQKEASFGFSLKGSWNKVSETKYNRVEEFKASYEAKFKKLYNLFSSVGAMADGITAETKGNVRNIGLKNMPISFAVKPPNINLTGEWKLENIGKEKSPSSKIGTKIDLSLNAQPLIGLEMNIDLLCSAVGVVAGAVSGGTAAPGATRLYKIIKDKINTGVELGDDDFGVKASADVYIDLVISSTISTSIGFNFNTSDSLSNSDFKIEATNKLKVELKAGLWAKAEVSIITVKVEGYFEMSGKGSASITFGHGIKYDEKHGLFYQPKLGFDGLDAEYVIKGKVGMSFKKKVADGKAKANLDNEDNFSQGEYKGIIPKFDVIESLGTLFGTEILIPIIKNN